MKIIKRYRQKYLSQPMYFTEFQYEYFNNHLYLTQEVIDRYLSNKNIFQVNKFCNRFVKHYNEHYNLQRIILKQYN